VRYVTVKKLSDVKVAGVKLEADVVNDTFNSVTLFDKDGNFVRFKSPYGNLSVEVKAPPKTEKKTVLVVKGMPVAGDFEKPFDNKYDAEQAARDARSAGADSAEVVERDVPVSDDTIDSTIPF
jgi:hypothetical protein